MPDRLAEHAMRISRRRLCRFAGAGPVLLAGHPLLSAGGMGCGGMERRVLHLYNWGDYLAPATVSKFVAAQKRAGQRIELRQSWFLSEAELAEALTNLLPYDVCFPVDHQLPELQRNALLRPLEETKLPGLANLDPQFPLWRASVEQGGLGFAVPYLWGTTGIGYDSDKVDPPPQSWQDLFDGKYAGRISLLDSKQDVILQALLAAGKDPAGDEASLREVWPRLREQRSLLRGFDSSAAEALVGGSTWIAQIDSGDLLRARDFKPSLRYVIPREGAPLWVDYLAIPVTAASPELAQQFLEFLLQPEIAAENAAYVRYATPNRAAIDGGFVKPDPAIYPSAEVRARLFRTRPFEGPLLALTDAIWFELRGR